MRGKANCLGGLVSVEHGGNWTWRRIRRIRWIHRVVQCGCVGKPVGIRVKVVNSAWPKGFRNLDVTGSLMIVKVSIPHQLKDSWNLGVEAKQLKLQYLTVEQKGNQ